MTAESKVVILIPACNPGSTLPDLVRELLSHDAAPIVVVNDGSKDECAPFFDELSTLPGVSVLKHAVNLGKGAALKTAFNFACCEFPNSIGFVTADADGQHAVNDILAVARQLVKTPDVLVLGVRGFSGDVPFRSRFGNQITKTMVRLLVGQRLADTQTGLRGIPHGFALDLLKIPAKGYEFELDMLIAAKHASIHTTEIPIQTIYLDGNRSSMFNPILDSMRIYFVLLRFGAVALITALIDNGVFFLAYKQTHNIVGSLIAARIVAMCFNYTAARKAVFLSDEPHRKTLTKYLSLVFFNACLSYALINLLAAWTGVPVPWAKLIAETLLFLGNFAIQREFVFMGGKRGSGAGSSTDWTSYYNHVPPTARLTRRYTAAVVLEALKRFAPNAKTIVEIGGANSCVADSILDALKPAQYKVIDNNERGLDLLRKRFPDSTRVIAENLDVLQLPFENNPSDVVFSVGLLEHFSPQETANAVRAHFTLVKDCGLVMFTFSTPTALYRAARAACELVGIWKFPDERPLVPEEVLREAREFGTVVFEKTLWPLVLTQYFIAVSAHKLERLTLEALAIPELDHFPK